MPEQLRPIDLAQPLATPVAFFVFNRPEYTRRVWTAICKAKPAILLIVADGPRCDRPDDNSHCNEVRRIVTGEIDWPCDRRLLFAETNLGCRARVASGLRWVFNEAEEAIIIEDDCLPDPTFFPFCQELLVRYRTDERIGMIAGTNYRPLSAETSHASYFASRHFSIWGWATWRRTFAGYNELMPAWRTISHPQDLSPLVPLRTMRRLLITMFDLAREGGIDSWDIAWGHHLLNLRALSLVPAQNLVTNIGIEGTRGRSGDSNQLRPIAPLPFPLRHPKSFCPDPGYERLVTARHRIIRDWLRALWTLRLKRCLRLG